MFMGNDVKSIVSALLCNDYNNDNNSYTRTRFKREALWKQNLNRLTVLSIEQH